MQHWARTAADYAEPDFRRSSLQLMVTVVPMAALWAAMVASVQSAYWLTLLLSVPTAAFLMRLFMIQHDCGHRSYFKSSRLNDLLGHAIGVLTLTPHGYWRRAHNIHHASSGNLEKRGIGDIHTLTVAEYRALSPLRRLAYRIYRHPITLLGVGPLYVFVFKYRLPLDLLRRQRGALVSVMATNLAIAGLVVSLGLWIGFAEMFMVQAPIIFLAGCAGVWLFYVQHQFEHGYWRRDEDWSFQQAALHGSSYYHLPKVLSWFTAHIGLHHIHHLSSRIPNYRLQECLDAVPELKQVSRLTLLSSLRCLRFSLWDEASEKMIGFRDLKGLARAGQRGRSLIPGGS